MNAQEKTSCSKPVKIAQRHDSEMHDMPKKAGKEMEIVINCLEGINNFLEAAEARNYLASMIFFAGQFNESIELYQNNIALAREKHLKQSFRMVTLVLPMFTVKHRTPSDGKNFLTLSRRSKTGNNPALIAQACLRGRSSNHVC